MRLKELAGILVPDRLKSQLDSATYEDFLALLRAQNATQVIGVPGRKTLFRTGSHDLGEDGAGYEYNVTFTGLGQTGRKMGLYLPCVQKFLDNPDYINVHGGKMGAGRLIRDLEEAYLVTTYVTAETKLAEIKQLLPNCRTILRDAEKEFSEEDFEVLHKRAQQLQVRPW